MDKLDALMAANTCVDEAIAIVKLADAVAAGKLSALPPGITPHQVAALRWFLAELAESSVRATTAVIDEFGSPAIVVRGEAFVSFATFVEMLRERKVNRRHLVGLAGTRN